MFEWLKRKKKDETPEEEVKEEVITEPEAEEDSEKIEEPEVIAEPEAAEEPEAEREHEVVEAPQTRRKPGFFTKFFGTLFKDIDDDFYDELEEILIMGDMGVVATEELIENLKDSVATNREIKNTEDAKRFLMEDIKRIMRQPSDAYAFEDKNSVVMVIGVNGVGKTTCVGKLANLYNGQRKKVILAGADTFRAAAMDQLKVWSERSGCYMVSGSEGADPGSVVFDAAKAAKARGADILLCDTAGRLHNKKNLMNELAKLDKIIKGELSDFSRQNLIVLDATTGQNALSQAKEFKGIMDIDGIILTKMDGTAKGGIAVAITRELGVPVKYIGIGEGIDDLIRFDPELYVDELFA